MRENTIPFHGIWSLCLAIGIVLVVTTCIVPHRTVYAHPTRSVTGSADRGGICGCEGISDRDTRCDLPHHSRPV